MAVPYIFAGATSAIPLSQLDTNFATTFTLGNTAIQLGNTVTTLNNMTLANVTISSGNVTITNVSVTTANVTTGNITTLTSTNATITNMSSGNVTITGGTINGTTLGATTAASANVTTLTTSSTVTHDGGTANGVAYLNGSKVLTTGSALTFNGTDLGVGTASPPSKLSVYTATGGSTTGLTVNASGNMLNLFGSSSTNAGVIFDATDGTVGSATGVPIIYRLGGSEQMRLTSTGLGIGLSNPAYRLQVAGGYSVLGSFNTTSYAASSNTVGGASFSWNRSGGGAETNIVNLYDNATLSFEFAQKTGASTANRLYQLSSTSHIWFTGDTERARITATGAFGIGTTTPATLLQVNDTITIGTADKAVQWLSGGSALADIRADSSSNLIFRNTASYTERARITSGGRLNIGTTGGSATRLEIEGGETQCTFINTSATDATYKTTMSFTDSSGTQRGTITVNNSATQYNTSSDYRLKENIQPMTGALAKVASLKPCTFNWKIDGVAGEGFIAHELAEVVPDAVAGEKDAVDAEGKPVYQGIDTSFLVATLTAAIQEQQAIITDLRARVAQLEAK